jgi:CPA1 family monovalent cation:H+ antiporter
LETVTLVLLLLVALLASSFLLRMSRLPVPLPLAQIVVGAAIGSVADLRVELDPQIFFLLFLPPLLFIDGWRIPKQGLFRDAGTILELALGLVIFTVVGMAFFIHWLIPAMPLAVCFALAAVLSPTDPVAVSAIAARVAIPKRMMHILEGESLLNDASGLVCLRFAIAAALTGAFSLPTAFLTFLQLALGGVAVGVAVTWIITKIKNWISRRYGEEPGVQILVSLLMPFAAYLAAEHLHCSGILAAVAAGITMSYAELSGQALAITRVRRNAVWDTVQYTANGIIFILLGEQLPIIFSKAASTVWQAGHYQTWWLGVYVVAITLTLGILRFLWVWVSLEFTLFRASRKGHVRHRPSWRALIAMTVAGVRGAITLAGILTLPLVLSDGSPFPARDLAIFIAAGVIVLSLVIASVALPRLLAGYNDMLPESSHATEEDWARQAANAAAIRTIERVQHEMAEGRNDADIYAAAADRAMDLYRLRMAEASLTDEEVKLSKQVDEIERTLRLAGFKAERDEIFRLARSHELEDAIARRIVRDIDLREARYW